MAKREKMKRKRASLSNSYMEQYGYWTESHEVQTEDGYILTLLRLRKAFDKDKDDVDKPPVLVVHGLLSQGDHWCMIKPENGLPYQLLEEGYDCWLANLRGTPLSRTHTHLKTDSKKYWSFSFHEMGVYDLPSMIDYILETTGFSSLSYVGHSMGCSVLFVLLSVKEEYQAKVNCMIALAPPVYGKHIRNIVFRFLMGTGIIAGASRFIRNRECGDITAEEAVKRFTLKSQRLKVAGWIMVHFGMLLGGFGKSGIEKERARQLTAELPAPTSLKLVCHGLQCLHSNKPRQYNYGRSGNLKIYRQPKPPMYDLDKITIPIITFSSEGDAISTPKDVTNLNEILSNVTSYKIEDRKFSHVDFLLGKDAHHLVYRKIIHILKKSQEISTVNS